jgi:SAM-dependent methyltransferase
VSDAAPTDPVAYFSEIASEFHASYADDPNRRDRIITWRRALSRFAGQVNLAYDVGCGSGMLIGELAPYAQRIVAIDGSGEMLEIARKTVAPQLVPRTEFRQHRLPVQDDSLTPGEIVISSSVVEYLESVDGSLAFMHRLLKPGGLFVFSISNRNSIKRRAVRLFYRFTGRPRYLGLVRHFLSVGDVRRAVENAGFELLGTEFFDNKDRFNRALSVLFPPEYCANLILAVARRPEHSSPDAIAAGTH